MMVGEGLERCPRCGQTKALTSEHFYFRRSDGQRTGFCKTCHRSYMRAYRATKPDAICSPEARLWHRLLVREAYRRRRGVTPDRYRPRRYAENQGGAA